MTARQYLTSVISVDPHEGAAIDRDDTTGNEGALVLGAAITARPIELSGDID